MSDSSSSDLSSLENIDSLNEIDWPGENTASTSIDTPYFPQDPATLSNTTVIPDFTSNYPYLADPSYDQGSDSSSGPTDADNVTVKQGLQNEQDYRASQIETAAVNKSRMLAQQAAQRLNDKISKALQDDAKDFVMFQLSLVVDGATLGAGKAASSLIGGVSGAASGAISGGKKGALVGLTIGLLGGRFASKIAGAAADAVGGDLAGMQTGTATFVGLNSLAGGSATTAGNWIAGEALSHDLGYGLAIGAFGPLASGEAFLVGAGGEAAFGSGAGAWLGIQSGLYGAAATGLDPNSENGINRHK